MASTRSIPRHILPWSTTSCRTSLPRNTHHKAIAAHSLSTFVRQPTSPPALVFPYHQQQSRRSFTTAQVSRSPPAPQSPPSSSPDTTGEREASHAPRPPSTPPPGGVPRFRGRLPNTPATPFSASKLATRDRGPVSKEETQTDFGKMNVLGNTATPATSVDICAWDGFVLDSGLRVGDGDGVLLVGADAFLWRPWMGRPVGGGDTQQLVHGSMLKQGKNEYERTGGVLNQKGQFEVANEVWGLFKSLWPKPDLLIIGTGPTIRPLAPSTRQYLQSLGMRIDVLDTRNAASQFNMLATERGVLEIAAALVPIGFGLKD